MKNRDFRTLKNAERKARLLRAIACKTRGQLSKEELEQIVNTVNVSSQFTIKVVEDAKEFSTEITLEDSGWSNLDDYQKTEDTGEVVLGKVEFGKKGTFEIFNNGNLSQTINSEEMPNFDPDTKNVVVIRHEEETYKTYGYQETRYYDEKNFLIIYLPQKQPYTMDEDVKYILDMFNI